MTTLGSNIYPTTTGGEIVSTVILIVGIGFVALLTGAFAQRFLGPEIAEVEEELENEELSAEAVAMRELRSVREQLQALEVAVERMVDQRTPNRAERRNERRPRRGESAVRGGLVAAWVEKSPRGTWRSRWSRPRSTASSPPRQLYEAGSRRSAIRRRVAGRAPPPGASGRVRGRASGALPRRVAGWRRSWPAADMSGLEAGDAFLSHRSAAALWRLLPPSRRAGRCRDHRRDRAGEASGHSGPSSEDARAST